MAIIKQVRRTYKYRMYHNDKRDKYLFNQIDIAGIIWNHCLALQRRYYQLTGKYISRNKLQKHIAKLARERPQYRYWRTVGSQAVQDVVERLDKAYQ